MQLTNDQENALKAIRQWFFKPKNPYFLLSGDAGTGKTTIIPYIRSLLRVENASAVITLTNVARLVLKDKGVEDAQTIHSFRYTCNRDNEGNLRFTKIPRSDYKHIKLIIVDEGWMMNETLFMDILSLRKPVLVIGDNFQLPAIGNPILDFMTPDYTLKEPTRTSAESVIYRLSQKYRNMQDVDVGNYDDAVFVVPASDVGIEYYLEADQVLTGTNKNRMALNNKIRNALGHTTEYPVMMGAKIILTENKYDLGVYNGQMLEVEDFLISASEQKCSFTHRFTIDDKNIELDFYDRPFKEYNLGQYPKVKNEDYLAKSLVKADHGYCISVHKAQGSQYEMPLLYDCGFGYWEDKKYRFRWLYTALTRASKSMIIAKSTTALNLLRG